MIVSGTIGDHGITIISTREGIEFETALESDTAPLNDLTRKMLDVCRSIRVMRDPTRGGISSTLNELAKASGVGITLDEASIPVRPEVHAACEMLGLDPLFVANEGKLIVVIPETDVNVLLDVMHHHPLGRDAAVIGSVVAVHLKVGHMSGVVKEALRSAFELARKETILEHAELVFEDVPVKLLCPKCECEQPADSIQNLCCAVCGTISPNITQGGELEVVAMELELSEVVT